MKATCNVSPSPIKRRSVRINGQSTSISLEDAFWKGLREIAKSQRTSIKNLVSQIEGRPEYYGNENHNLSSRLRLFVLDYYRSAAEWQARKQIHA